MANPPPRHSSHSVGCIYLSVRPSCWPRGAAKCDSTARSSSPSASIRSLRLPRRPHSLEINMWGETDKYKASWVAPASALSCWGHFNIIFFFMCIKKKNLAKSDRSLVMTEYEPSPHHRPSRLILIRFCIFHLLNQGVFFTPVMKADVPCDDRWNRSRFWSSVRDNQPLPFVWNTQTSLSCLQMMKRWGGG